MRQPNETYWLVWRRSKMLWDWQWLRSHLWCNQQWHSPLIHPDILIVNSPHILTPLHRCQNNFKTSDRTFVQDGKWHWFDDVDDFVLKRSENSSVRHRLAKIDLFVEGFIKRVKNSLSKEVPYISRLRYQTKYNTLIYHLHSVKKGTDDFRAGIHSDRNGSFDGSGC